MDTFVLNAIAQELQYQICPSRINTIWQPDEYSLVFGLWYRRTESYLVMSVAPHHQYLFLTSQLPDNQVGAFGKFLHHHIKGGEIRALHKPMLERILTFEITRQDIDGQDLQFRFILEIMGRYSNLILVNQETNKILDSIRHVTATQSSYRRIAPGAVYVPPPKQDKIDPATIDREQFQQILSDYEEVTPTLSFWKFFLQRVEGFSPLMAKEVAGQGAADSDNEARWQRFATIMEVVKSGNYQPTLVIEQDEQGMQKPIALSAVLLQTKVCTPNSLQTEVCTPKMGSGQTEVCTPNSMNQAAEWYYGTLVERQQYETLKALLLSPLNARLSKLRKKQEHLHTQKEQIENAEQYKKQGELITTNIYQLKKGMRMAEVVDYYTEGQPVIEIPLDPRFTPAQNAQRYFKRYNKLKQGKDITMHRLCETEQEIAYLEERKFFIEEAESIQHLKELQDELEEMKKRSRKEKVGQQNIRQENSGPFLRFISSDGFEIYVGRSGKENDLLTQRTALPDDIWLHVHQAPGSHVLILNRNRNAPVPEQTLKEAASLAAYYSKLRHSGKVDVIYTPRKYVKKLKGSPPGLVTLSQFQTIRVVPQAEI
jgi:predicted ribosome quality control (RQC) complex YloA/Tae2 family protein